jgi:hypothetical protein
MRSDTLDSIASHWVEVPALPRTLLSLHFLARDAGSGGKVTRLSDGRYESGNWKVAVAVAEQAAGAEIHLHERQGSASWIAGRIDGWRRPADEPGRVVFSFAREDALCREEPDGWGHGAEKKYVWAE